jgi:UDP-N-acetylmuramate dehydrogenase
VLDILVILPVMLRLEENKNLKNLNTFGIEARASRYCEIHSVQDFLELIKAPVYQNNRKLIIGGGSNILFTGDFNGLVIKNSLKGIKVTREDGDAVSLKAMAGENWHEFVMWCIDRNYCGLENLSLIPGCVGASPMQNIGAYGVEIKEYFEELEAYDMQNGDLRIFKKSECEFGYRESVFKRIYKDKYLISSVTYRLKKKPDVNISYGAISSELKSAGIEHPRIKDVSDAVIRIRRSKLPDPAVVGNAGSFFKNPEVTADKHAELKSKFPDLVSYPLENGKFKLAAGWLIEQCGLKGHQYRCAAVHDKQALVLINKGNCDGKTIFDLSTYVLELVSEKYGVDLEREVNIV